MDNLTTTSSRSAADGERIESYGEQGLKPVVKGKQAVCSSSHPLVTETVLQVMRAGGNAVDAAVAGSLLQPVVEPHMTSHGGSVTCLYWEAKTGQAYQLDALGTLVPGLAPFRPLPANLGGFVFPSPAQPPCACIPGFMPGLQAMHERFGTRPWSDLCQPAIRWAEEGHPVSSFEYGVLQWGLPSNTYFPAGREHFLPGGFPVRVGERFTRPDLAETMRQVAKEGPAYFTTGVWAQHFVAEANRLGWPITMGHMTAIGPRWQPPLRYEHNGYHLIQLAPPESVGVATALVLGILGALGLQGAGTFTESAESLYLMAHTLRRMVWETGLLYDPQIFDVPTEIWLSDNYHRSVAKILQNSRPKIDLSEHIRLTVGDSALAAAGLAPGVSRQNTPPAGSCELSIVDSQGNWLEMINTVQTGGIPGAVVDGVPMWGSHAFANLATDIAGWTVGGGRARCIIGNTLVLKNERPWLALGTPGEPFITVPQVLWNILDAGLDPAEAAEAPRLWPLQDDYTVEVESRVPGSVIAGLAQMGIRAKMLPPYDWHLGSFQICWRDEATQWLNSYADPRRAGKADGF
jgi:gamma-glutamyltranspeptidase / glutathione hydrolase